jgi:hypothetical protein
MLLLWRGQRFSGMQSFSDKLVATSAGLPAFHFPGCSDIANTKRKKKKEKALHPH